MSALTISLPIFVCSAAIFISAAQKKEKLKYSNTNEKFNSCIYLDYNATTPIYEEVGAIMTKSITESFGNPSSSHVFGLKSKETVVNARQAIGQLIGAIKPLDSIIFTSCGTEADNRAIDLAINIFKCNPDNIDKKPTIITCITEHPAVICYLRQLRIDGTATVTVLPVDSQGFVDAAKIEANLTIDTALVTIMHSNNETGTLQPIRDISRRIRQFNSTNKTTILFHTDAAQSVGKVPIDVEALAVDMLTIVGHKMGAPKGVAALYINHKFIDICRTKPMLIGGGQENGIRSGTESTILIAGLGEASRLYSCESKSLLLHMLRLKLRLVEGLIAAFGSPAEGKIRFNGPNKSCVPEELKREIRELHELFPGTECLPARRFVDQLPNTVSVSFRGIYATSLLALLADKVACSAGSACHTGTEHVMSPILEAMGVPVDFALGTLRLCVGRATTTEEVNQAVEYIHRAVIDATSLQSLNVNIP